MFTKREKYALAAFCGIQLVILCIVCLRVFTDKDRKFSQTIKDPQSRCFAVCGAMDEQKGGYYVDETNGTRGLFTCGPYTKLKKGIYDVTVSYESTGGNHTCYAYWEDAECYYNALESDVITLDANHTWKKFRIWVNRDMNEFEVQTTYGGSGSLLIREITVTGTTANAVNRIVRALFLFLAIDLIVFLCIAAKKHIISANSIVTGAFLAGIILFASVPLFRQGLLYYQADLNFILMRIDGLKDGMLSGQFPVRIQPDWLNGYGYATSVFYGDLLLVIPALLRIAGFSVQEAYFIYCFLINVATCLIAYFCLKGMFGRRSLALLGSGIYTLASYRLLMVYFLARGGMFSAYTFLPLVAYGIYIVLHEPKNRKGFIALAIGMTGIIQSHLLTGEITVFAIAVVCLLAIRLFIRKDSFLAMLKGVGLAVFLNIGFLVPLFNCMSGKYITSEGWKQMWYYIQRKGLGVDELFSFCKGNTLRAHIDVVLIIGLFAFALILVLVPIEKIKEEHLPYRRMGKITLPISGLFLIMGTKYFPWDWIEEECKFLRMPINSIQVPERFFQVVMICAIMTLCCVLILLGDVCENIYCRFVTAGIAMIFCVTSGMMISAYVNEPELTRRYDTAALDVNRICNKEYLPEGADPDLYTREAPFMSGGGYKYPTFKGMACA